ncbi:MAG: EamA family transporter [Armatimonadota bacterium]
MKAALPLILAGITALCWGVAPVLGKMGLVKADPLAGLAWRTMVVTVCVVGLAAGFGRLPMLSELTPRALAFLAAEGVLASLVGHFAYYWALKYGNVAQVVPIASSFPLIAVLAGFVLVSQSLSWKHAVGALLIFSGVVVISR